MTKSELIDALYIAKGSYFKKHQIASLVDELSSVISAELYQGNEVTLPGIGKLVPKTSPARTGKNPQNGEPVEIPAKNKVAFKASKILLDALNK